MEMKNNCLFFDITKQEQDSAIRYLLGAIIKCRKEDGFPSNYYTFDEDVNIYLAHLLFAVALPQYHEIADPYLSTNAFEVMQWIRNTEDRTMRYFIFKINADNLLIHSAVFNDLTQKPRKAFFRKSKKHFREMAKLYYDQAASYHKRIYRKRTAVGEVLDKLSRYYEAYQQLLVHVRRDYFQFIENFRNQAFRFFMHEVDEYEAENKKKSRMDEFLDVYGRWLETKDPHLEKIIQWLVSELEVLDPDFHFNIEKQFHRRGGGSSDQRKCA